MQRCAGYCGVLQDGASWHRRSPTPPLPRRGPKFLRVIRPHRRVARSRFFGEQHRHRLTIPSGAAGQVGIVGSRRRRVIGRPKLRPGSLAEWRRRQVRIYIRADGGGLHNFGLGSTSHCTGTPANDLRDGLLGLHAQRLWTEDGGLGRCTDLDPAHGVDEGGLVALEEAWKALLQETPAGGLRVHILF